jgi:TPR repeat protein
LKKGAELFQKAADQGDNSARYYLGRCYTESKGVEKNMVIAVSLFQMAADHRCCSEHANKNLACATCLGLVESTRTGR